MPHLKKDTLETVVEVDTFVLREKQRNCVSFPSSLGIVRRALSRQVFKAKCEENIILSLLSLL